MVLLGEKNISIVQEILDVIYKLALKYNIKAYLVGGPVRDFLMAQEKNFKIFKDLDIALTGYYQEIGNELASVLKARPIFYPRFMTMTISLSDFRVDIAQTRKEIYPQPAVLPQVFPATIEEDLKRRDFTINAMAIPLTEEFIKNTEAQVLDPLGGQTDIKDKLIRILHPKSFIDDPTRIFRALRFASRLGFKLEETTAQLMQDAIHKSYLTLLSGERVFYELEMICKEKNALKILAELQERKVIKKLYKTQLPQDFFLYASKLSNDEKLVYLFSFFADKHYKHYPLKKEFILVVRELQKSSELTRKLKKIKRRSTIYFLLKPYHLNTLNILKKITHGSVRKKIVNYLTKLKDTKIHTTGQTLKRYNIAPGPSYHKILNKILAYKLDGKIKTPKDEERYLNKLLGR
ncbi:MAG: hypothetical protein RMJ65_02385 [candidate division WOR-3 bacterium]|nr:hypothetical protein [candidate division WOR-3 bacterium]